MLYGVGFDRRNYHGQGQNQQTTENPSQACHRIFSPGEDPLLDLKFKPAVIYLIFAFGLLTSSPRRKTQLPFPKR